MAAFAKAMFATQASGAAMKILGGWQAGRSQRWGLRQRAKSLEFDAVETERQGEYEASQMDLEARRLRARQLVQFAKSGVMPEGTPKLVMAESKAQASADTGRRRRQTNLEASQLRLQAIYMRRMAASNKIQSIFGMLGGAAQSAQGLYGSAKKAGWLHTKDPQINPMRVYRVH